MLCAHFLAPQKQNCSVAYAHRCRAIQIHKALDSAREADTVAGRYGYTKHLKVLERRTPVDNMGLLGHPALQTTRTLLNTSGYITLKWCVWQAQRRGTKLGLHYKRHKNLHTTPPEDYICKYIYSVYSHDYS